MGTQSLLIGEQHLSQSSYLSFTFSNLLNLLPAQKLECSGSYSGDRKVLHKYRGKG